MRINSVFLMGILSLCLCTSCFEDRDDTLNCSANDLEIKDFIYRGMNFFYLYKSEKQVLSNNYFNNQQELNSYLDGFNSPESFFSSLIVPQDRFSILVDDYRTLENSLNGLTLNNGMAYGIVRIQSSGEIFGYVRYVLPNTSASRQGVERGMIFNRIDGQNLTAGNFRQLLGQRMYSIGLANLNENYNLSPIDQEIPLTKEQYNENPVFIDKIISTQNTTVGYLMYNAFTRPYDDELNAAFARFQSEGVDQLIVDLRYNGGGSIESSNDLGSMITGQFNGELFTKQVYNENFESRERYFNSEISSGENINSLNLNKVYIITTGSTASASELLVSSLRPYIDVEQVGTSTVGKFQGSITVYDSPDFSRENVNLCHTYAMQPLVLKSVNANGFTGYVDGLQPGTVIEEDFRNLGVLGSPQEPLLARTLNLITGAGRPQAPSQHPYELLSETEASKPNFQRMYAQNPE